MITKWRWVFYSTISEEIIVSHDLLTHEEALARTSSYWLVLGHIEETKVEVKEMAEAWTVVYRDRGNAHRALSSTFRSEEGALEWISNNSIHRLAIYKTTYES